MERQAQNRKRVTPDAGRQWAVVRTAPDQLTAEIWRETLAQEGIPSTLAAADAVSFLGLSAAPCRLIVPATMIEAADVILRGELWSAPIASESLGSSA